MSRFGAHLTSHKKMNAALLCSKHGLSGPLKKKRPGATLDLISASPDIWNFPKQTQRIEHEKIFRANIKRDRSITTQREFTTIAIEGDVAHILSVCNIRKQ